MISTRDFKEIFKVLPTASLIIAPNCPKFTVTAVNDAYLALTELSEKELLGKDFTAAFSHSQYLDWKKSVIKVLNSKTADKISTVRYVTHSKNDQDVVTRHVEIANVPILNPNNEVSHIVCSFVEIPDYNGMDAISQPQTHWESEPELLRAHQQYQTILENIDGVLWELNIETQALTLTNEYHRPILGYSKAEWQSSKEFWKRHLHPSDRELVSGYFDAQHYKSGTFNFECRMANADGRYVWLKNFVTVIADNEQPVILRGLMIDISENKRLNNVEYFEKKILKLNAKRGSKVENILTAYILGLEEILPDFRCTIHRVMHGRIYNWASPSLPRSYINAIDGLLLSKSIGSCGAAAYLRQSVIVHDIKYDLRWQKTSVMALATGLRACWSYPVINTEGEVMATLGFYSSEPRSPSENEEIIIKRAIAFLKVILESRIYSDQLEGNVKLLEEGQHLAKFGNWTWDTHTDVVRWSDYMFEIYGLDKNKDKITFEEYLNLLHHEDKERVSISIGGVLSTKKDIEYETRIVRPDGEVRLLKSWCKLKMGEHGEVISMLGACLDITDSRKAEQDVSANEAKLRDLVDSQTNFVVRVDLKGNFTYCNKKYEEVFGSCTEGADVFGSKYVKSVFPRHFKMVFDVAEKCLMQPGNVYQVEIDSITLEGRVIHTLWDMVCLTDKRGGPYELQAIGIDITEWKQKKSDVIGDVAGRKAIDAKSKAMHERYRDLFLHSPQPMWVYEVDTLRFIDVNEAAIKCYGYSREEFLSADTVMIKLAEDMHRYLEVTESANQEKNRVFQGVFRHQHKNGEVLHMDIRSNQMRFNDKDIYLVLASDITARINYFEGIERQNEKLKEIAWMQSHVVRAPLTRMMSLIDLLKMEESRNSENNLLFEYLLSSAIELDEIVKDISVKTPKV
ncbi:PAS domain S-box protein [Pedobacter sp.]|uniref:PAS domain S-box protein n=1 Tax=Pedobacter sp. TaxID=1411316 RepID=UPI003D7F492D